MLQFARRRRWFLSLTLLLTVVTVQQLLPADGAGGREERASVTYEEDFSGAEDGEAYSEADVEEQSKRDTSRRDLASRTQRRTSLQRGRGTAALLPLFLVGLAAAFAAAGFVVKQYKKKGGAAPRAATDKSTPRPQPKKVSPVTSSKTDQKSDLSPQRVQSWIELGKRVLPPAVALGVVTLVVTMVAQNYGTSGTPKRG